MKTRILLGIFALYTGFTFGATVTITNVGFAFSPDDVTINFGDVVDFQLESTHNAVEVSEATWLANGNTALPGFSVPFGGGQVTDLTPGVHYYVCQPHASGGMKGKITVIPTSGIGDNESGIPVFNLFPNPTRGEFIFKITGDGFASGKVGASGSLPSLEISDLLGKKVFSLKEINLAEPVEVDISSFPDGIYFVRLNDDKKIYTRKLIKY